MKAAGILRGAMLLAVAALASTAAPPGEVPDALAARLMAQLESIRTVSCTVRKDIETETGTLRFLSRVQYARPDRLHVENIRPVKRRIIADGTTFYSHIDGLETGFSRQVAALDEDMLIELRKVPGSAWEHLYRIRGLPEDVLPGTDGLPVRRGYAGPKLYTILGCDAQGRLAHLEFYHPDRRDELLGAYDYSGFREVAPGVWIPMLHKGHARVDGIESRETTRFDNYQANEPAPEHLFRAAPFFKDVEFVPDFDKMTR